MSDANTPIGHVAKYVKEQIPAQVAEAVSNIEVPAGQDGSDGTDGLGFNLKNWEEAIHREGVVVQHNIGQAYKALVDTNAEPGHSSDWERVGSAGFRWTGVKKADHDYNDGDLYIDGGTTFLWNGSKGYMIAQRGKNGKDGSDGSHGKDGSDAPVLLEVTWDSKGMAFVYDDGSMIEADVPGLEKLQKQMSWLEEQFLTEEKIEAPIKEYNLTSVWKFFNITVKIPLVFFNFSWFV